MAAIALLLRRWRRMPAVVALAGILPVGIQAQKPAEYEVKAAYLYGFGRFVEWPAHVPAATRDAFVVCVLGDDPFGRELDDVTAGAVMREKPVSIRRISEADESGPCDTLFISASEDVRMGKILEALGHRPMLTVSDAPRFAQRGGMIGFFLDGERVRFTVNLAAAQAAGLRLNSELLRVAATVIKTRQAGD